jgi:hypothetical protein
MISHFQIAGALQKRARRQGRKKILINSFSPMDIDVF